MDQLKDSHFKTVMPNFLREEPLVFLWKYNFADSVPSKKCDQHLINSKTHWCKSHGSMQAVWKICSQPGTRRRTTSPMRNDIRQMRHWRPGASRPVVIIEPQLSRGACKPSERPSLAASITWDTKSPWTLGIFCLAVLQTDRLRGWLIVQWGSRARSFNRKVSVWSEKITCLRWCQWRTKTLINV